LTPEMQALLDLTNQNTKTRNQKQYHECGKKEIENSKCKCPQCHAKLLTLAKTQQEKEQTISDKKKKDPIKLLTFRPYQSNTSKSNKSTGSISITQNFEPQDIFDHFQNISGINNGSQKWIVIVSDGLSYYYAQKFKNEYPRIILLPGPLHKEINMLKAFMKLNWNIDLQDFTQYQGYRTKNQLEYFKNMLITIKHGIQSDKEQLMHLYPEIHQIIEYNSVVAQLGLSNQYQRLGAILEKINRILKMLILPILTQKHWEIAARNYYEEKSQRFQIQLRKTGFLNPNLNNGFDSLDKNNKLSVQMKSFRKFGLISSEPTQSIPVTFDKVQLQSAKSLLKKDEIEELLTILQQVQDLKNAADIDVAEETT
ncbi:33257_t:CDS:2, partial [Gigaspora margarita]